MRYQAWSTDEYGQNSILQTSADFKEIFNVLEKTLGEMNVENALTSDEKLSNWEAFLPVVVNEKNEISTQVLYAGRNTKGHYVFYVMDGDNYDEVGFDDVKDNYSVRFYLGKLDNEAWFATNQAIRNKDNFLNDITEEIVRGKTILSFNIIN